MSLPIEDYALLGDTGTAALVSRAGSVDWLCLPRYDSPACFAALLGDHDHGHWLIGPEDPDAVTTRRYLGETSVLETTHRTATGTVRVVDVMPLADGRADLVRQIEGVEGQVRLRHEWVVRFGYGKIRPWVTRQQHHGQEVITAVAGPDRLMLQGPRLPEAEDGHHVDSFEVRAGESLCFSSTWQASHRPLPGLLGFEPRIEDTMRMMQRWADHCDYEGPFRAPVVRSLLTLRLLTHAGTGGIVAAPTTSLPEELGGERNWDYRFCWLRDASLTLEALVRCGYRHEIRLWRDWLLRAVAGDPADLQIMYTVDGARELPERVLEHLPGYADSRPVRVGNGAALQQQTDVLGEIMHALHLARVEGLCDGGDTWALQRTLIDELAEHWQHPDHGLWEIRGPARRFTHSRVYVWVAFDRAIRSVEEFGLDGDVDRWRTLRDAVRAEVLEHGVDHERGTFVQYQGSREVDASLLLIGGTGFLGGDDPLMLGTIEAVEQDLLHEGLLLRYRTESGVDGLVGHESPFLACSFWLVSAYARAGRVSDAEALLERLVGHANDVGLYAEELDPLTGRHLGNFPQAFSHLALVNAAVDLEEARASSG